VDIVCACDANFIAHMSTMLLSLAEHNRRHTIRVFILHDGPLPDCHKLVAMPQLHPMELRFISVEGMLPNVVVSHHVSAASYARMLVAQVLPLDIVRILYLDCDVIVRGDLGELWDTDLCGKTVGAIRDVGGYNRHSVLGLPQGAPYFNAGVLMIDLRRWRTRDIGRRSLLFVQTHPERLQWWDQCALNLMLHDDWRPLDPIWNFQSFEIGSLDYQDLVRFKPLPRPVRNRIRVVHFTGHSKPWHYMNGHPLKGEYLAYRRRTPWPLYRFEDRGRHNIVRRFLHRRLPRLLPLYMAARRVFGM